MKTLLIIVLCLVASSALAVEDLTLTAPLTQPSVTKWRFSSLELNRSASSVTAKFIDPVVGKVAFCTETGAAADTLMSALNTANLTSNSLQKRVMNWAISKSCIGAGTFSGTPD